jgi:hypothetical protein
MVQRVSTIFRQCLASWRVRRADSPAGHCRLATAGWPLPAGPRKRPFKPCSSIRSPHESAFASAVMRQHCSPQLRVVDGEPQLRVVDGGAYVGYFTMLAQAHGCRTVSVEPVKKKQGLCCSSNSVNRSNRALTRYGWVSRSTATHHHQEPASSERFSPINTILPRQPLTSSLNSRTISRT